MAGCQCQPPTCDPFFGRTTIPPPPTGAVTGRPADPCYQPPPLAPPTVSTPSSPCNCAPQVQMATPPCSSCAGGASAPAPQPAYPSGLTPSYAAPRPTSTGGCNNCPGAAPAGPTAPPPLYPGPVSPGPVPGPGPVAAPLNTAPGAAAPAIPPGAGPIAAPNANPNAPPSGSPAAPPGGNPTAPPGSPYLPPGGSFNYRGSSTQGPTSTPSAALPAASGGATASFASMATTRPNAADDRTPRPVDDPAADGASARGKPIFRTLQPRAKDDAPNHPVDIGDLPKNPASGS